MLEANQMADLDAAERDLKNKRLIVDTAIDVQALLRLLVDKEIITREEIAKYREEVRSSPKWNAMCLYIEQTQKEIEMYRKNPTILLRNMWAKKAKGE